MLKGVSPLAGPELLETLARMGHGDVLLVVDRNYPAYAAGVPVHRLDGVDAVTAVSAVLSLLPLDDFADEPVFYMHPVGEPQTVTPVQRTVLEVAEKVEGRRIGAEAVERFDFYSRAKHATAIIATSESQAYGCFGFLKGVIHDS